MTNDATRCEMYQAESQNVKSRFACVLPQGYITENLNEDDPIIPITQAECEVGVHTMNKIGLGWGEVGEHFT